MGTAWVSPVVGGHGQSSLGPRESAAVVASAPWAGLHVFSVPCGREGSATGRRRSPAGPQRVGPRAGRGRSRGRPGAARRGLSTPRPQLLCENPQRWRAGAPDPPPGRKRRSARGELAPAGAAVGFQGWGRAGAPLGPPRAPQPVRPDLPSPDAAPAAVRAKLTLFPVSVCPAAAATGCKAWSFHSWTNGLREAMGLARGHTARGEDRCPSLRSDQGWTQSHRLALRRGLQD